MSSPRISTALSRLQAERRKRPQLWEVAGSLLLVSLGLLQGVYHFRQAMHLTNTYTQFADIDLPFRVFLKSEAKNDGFDTNNSTIHSRFAYAFVIGGCDPLKIPTYQNYLFNIAVAARILKRLGSKVDVVVLFQMAQTATQLELPEHDLQLLYSLNVTVYYIPQQMTGKDSFYRTSLDKFRILGLTQYEKILLLDGDVMPLCNLDPLMEYETFQENVATQGLYEPFNAGFFVLKTGYLEEAQKIIEKREARAAELDYPYIDMDMGWGHNLTDDPWIGTRDRGTNWTFIGASADQGMLYYYTKYHRKSVSVLLRNGGVSHYGWNGTAVVKVGSIEKTTDILRSGIGPIVTLPGKHSRSEYPFNCFVHFTGNSKPWLLGGAPPDCCIPETQNHSAKHYWMYELSELLREQGRTDIDFQNHWDQKKKKQRPPLGLYPTYGQVVNASSNILTPLKRAQPKRVEGS